MADTSILDTALTQINAALVRAEADAAPLFEKRDGFLAVQEKARVAVTDLMPAVNEANERIAELRRQQAAIAKARGGRVLSEGPRPGDPVPAEPTVAGIEVSDPMAALAAMVDGPAAPQA